MRNSVDVPSFCIHCLHLNYSGRTPRKLSKIQYNFLLGYNLNTKQSNGKLKSQVELF